MAGQDLRPDFAVFVDAFGVPAIVTRPAPDDTPIATEGIWVAPLPTDLPFGTATQRESPKRVLALPRAAVPTIPRKTHIVAAEILGGTEVRWRVDGFEGQEVDHIRCIVVPDPEP